MKKILIRLKKSKDQAGENKISKKQSLLQSILIRFWHHRTIPKYSKNYLQLFGTVLFTAGVVFGVTFGGYKLIQKIFANTESTFTMPSGLAFNATGYDNDSGAVSVLSGEVRLATSSAWMNASFLAKKTITLNNLSGQVLNASGSAQVTINTKELFDAGKLQADCDDLRVAHIATGSANLRIEIPRSYQIAQGATNCSDSSATIVTFPRQEKLWVGQTSPNYEIYYNNSTASVPSYPKENYLSYDGNDDIVRVPHNVALNMSTGGYSAFLWVKIAAAAGSHDVFMSKGGASLGLAGYWWGIRSDGKMDFYLTDGTSFILQDKQGVRNLIDNQWHHVGFVWDPESGVTLYVDGQVDASHTGTSNSDIQGTQPLSIGGYGAGYGINGKLDDPVIYSKALTITEVGNLYRGSVSDTNLVGRWKLDEGTGQTVADSSANGLNGTVGASSSSAADDPTWVISTSQSNTVATKNATLACPFKGDTTCIGGQAASTATGSIRYSGGKSALSFDGANDYIEMSGANLSSILETNGTYSIETWIYPKKSLTPQGIFGWGDASLDRHGIAINAANYVQGGYYNGSYFGKSSNSAITPNAWYHVVYVNEGGFTSLYLNGVAQTGSSPPPLSGGDKHIGYFSNNGYFGGLIDEVVVYNRALTLSEAQAHYNSGLGQPVKSDSGTKLIYHFDENGDDPRNTGKTIDASSNGNHGTITGAKYVGGLAGVDSSSTDTGAISMASYAGHQGVFVENATTNLITNPSFENATPFLNWMNSSFTYATASATFTGSMAKRNSAGPFAAGPIIQGNASSTGVGDTLSSSRGNQVAGNFYTNVDANQGSVVLWVTPEWNGNDALAHTLLQFGLNGRWLLYKTSSSYLVFNDGEGINKALVNISGWTAGTTYNVVLRWDTKNTIDGTNYVSISVNDAHTYAATSIINYAPDLMRLGYYETTASGITFPANAIIEGVTLYRRVLFDGTYGTDVGNGDEINQIYNSGTGKDPTLVTGSWDVVFALPTNASTGGLATGTGNAWSMPHSSNLMGGTNGKNGFMTQGSAATDGLTTFSPSKVTNGGFNANLTGWTSTQDYLLRDEFTDTLAAGEVNGTTATDGVNARTVTDTGLKLSLSSGKFQNAGGSSASEMIFPIVSRLAGKVIVTEITSPSASGGFQIPVSDYTFYGAGSGILQLKQSDWVSVGSYTAGTSYKLATVYKLTGQYYYIKGGTEYPNWTLVYIGSFGTGSITPKYDAGGNVTAYSSDFIRIPASTWLPTPMAYDGFTRADGALGNSETIGPDSQTTPQSTWTGSTWQVSSNSAVNNPTLGTELLTNNSFANWTSDNPDGWTIATESSPDREISQVGSGLGHGGGGTGSANYYNTTGAGSSSTKQTVLTTGKWYRTETNASYVGTGTITAYYSNWPSYTISATGYKIGTGRADGTDFYLYRGTANVDLTVDDVTTKELSLPSLFGSLNTSTADVVASVNVNLAGSSDPAYRSTQAGLVLNLDSTSNPQNFVIAYHDGYNVKLEKSVAGVYTTVQNTATTYVAGATLKVIKYGSTYRVYYNNAMVGTEQTISDGNIVDNTHHGIFSTYSGNTLDNFTLFARGTDGEYAGIPAEDLTATYETTTKYAGAGSVKLIAAGNDASFTQTANVANTEAYTLTAYAYTTGVAVTSADLELWYDGSVLSTTYTSVGSGWYRLTGSVTGVASSKVYGVRVKTGKTVYVDDISLVVDTNNTSSADLATNQKIFSGGYAVTSDQGGGLYHDITVTAGQDLVIRGIAHSDGTSQPKLVLYDATNGNDIGSITGTTTSTKSAPDILLFTGEAPSGSTTIRVKMVNAAASASVVNWHQIELYSNLVNNPSMETGSGDPWIPTGWANTSGTLDAGDTVQETVDSHSSGKSLRYTTGTVGSEGVTTSTFTTTVGKFFALGMYAKSEGGGFSFDWSGANYQGTNQYWRMYTPGSSWAPMYDVARATATGPNLRLWNVGTPTGNKYIDDVYMILLDDVSLTATTASQANSTETSGLRIDGADVLSQPTTGLTTTSGVIKFKFTPRHSSATASLFMTNAPELISIFGPGDNYIYADVSASTLRIGGYFNGNYVTGTGAYTLNANTTYLVEINYQLGSNLVLKINGSDVASVAMPQAFSSDLTTAYFGSWSNNSEYLYDGTVTSFSTATVTENTTAPYYKFGSKSVKLVGQDIADEYVTSAATTNTGRHTISAYVYDGTTGNIGGIIDSSVVTIASGSASLNTTYEDVGGGWWRLSYTNTTSMPTGVYNWGVQVKPGKTIYLDGVQAENKYQASTFADGGMGSGYSWSGTADSSTSTRTATTLYYPSSYFNPNQGTISFWFKPTWDGNDGVYHCFFCKGVGGDTWGVYKQTSNRLYFNPNATDSSTRNIGSNTLTSSDIGKNKWYHLVATYNQSTDSLAMYLNGTLLTTTSSGTGWVVPDFGTELALRYDADSVMSDVRIFDQPLLASEVSDLYYQGLTTHTESTESDDRYLDGAMTYTSPVIDLSANGGWGDTPISFADQLNGGTISYLTRSSSDNSTWSDWAAVSGNAIASNARRYLQWKADINASADLTSSPVITGATVNYVEDTTPPINPENLSLGYTSEASSSATLESGQWYNYATPKFTWDASLDTPGEGQSSSGVASYHMLLTTDADATPSANIADDCYSAPVAGSESFIVGTTPSTCTLTDGIYYLRLQTKDNSGNTSEPVTTFVYKYDGTIPLAPTSVSSTTQGYSANNSFTFYWPAATDEGPSGVSGYEYKTGASGATWTYTTATTVANIIAYQEGQNFFYVRTKDIAGNYSGSTSNNVAASSFYYNASAPTAPINVTISPETTSDSPSVSNVFTVEWDKPASYSGEIAKYYYCVNCTPSETTMTETTAAETVNRKLENIALATQQGKNTFYIVAEDNNLNVETGEGNKNFDAYTSVDFYASTTAPGAPTALTVSDVSDRDNSIWRLTLAWKAATTGGTPSSYKVYQSTDDGAAYSFAGSTTSTAYTAADLSRNETYYFKVYAVDNAGSLSLASNAVSGSPMGKYSTPPSAGGIPSVASGSTTAIVTWTTGRAAFGAVEFGKTVSYGSVASEASASASHSIKVSGLAPGTEYNYRVQSLDDSSLVGYERSSAYSSNYTFTTLSSPAITDVTVDEVSLNSAIISWKTSSLSSAKVEYGETTDYGSEVEVSTTASANTHTARLASLKHSATYHFRVRGVDVDGNDIFSQDNTFSTLVFPKVTAVVFNTDQSDSGTTVVLAWSTNVKTNTEIDYQAMEQDPDNKKKYSTQELQKMSQTQLAAIQTIPKGRPQTIYSGTYELRHLQRIAGLSDGMIYVFTIRGRDGNGNQAISDPIRYVTGADTRPPQIENVIIETPISGVGSEAKAQIIISWETDEPAYGQVAWSQGTGSEYLQATEKDQALTTKHIMVIRDLEPTTSYHLKIVSTDKSGNTIESKDTVVVTPTSQAAAFDIIIKNLDDVFGFLKL